ncbi:MAG: hypothetical protein ACNS60_19775 [Candidatus Cyclobacteriaceae bacterium M2_1C_046]
MKNENAEAVKKYLDIKDLINIIRDESKRIILHYKNQKIEKDFQRVLYEFIKRVHVNYYTASKLFNDELDYLNSPYMKFSVFTLIRPLLSDFLILIYLIDFLETDSGGLKLNQAEFMKRYNNLTNQALAKTEAFLQKKIGQNKIEPKEKEELFQKYSKITPEHFDERLKVKKFSNANLAPGNLVNEIRKGSFKALADAYDQYFVLSQYEHFTYLTEDMANNTNLSIDYKLIKQSSNYLLTGIIISINLIDASNPFNKNLMDIKDQYYFS